jgi:hypothetical protein
MARLQNIRGRMKITTTAKQVACHYFFYTIPLLVEYRAICTTTNRSRSLKKIKREYHTTPLNDLTATAGLRQSAKHKIIQNRSV